MAAENYNTGMSGIKNQYRLDKAQITFTCWKLTIESLEKGVKYVQS